MSVSLACCTACLSNEPKKLALMLENNLEEGQELFKEGQVRAQISFPVITVRVIASQKLVLAKNVS